VCEIEALDLSIGWIRRRIQRCRKRKGIGNGQRVLLEDILAGLEVPPKIRVGDLSAKEAN
jgi:hypothetical protein